MTTQTAQLVTITTRSCMLCGMATRLDVTPEQARAIEMRTPIQNVFPELAVPTRELFISGTHPGCWEAEFG
jgi:hypothetical protein